MQTVWLARHANRQDFENPDWAATAERPRSRLPLASLTQMVCRDDGWPIRTRNDTHHLENGARASNGIQRRVGNYVPSRNLGEKDPKSSPSLKRTPARQLHCDAF